MVLFPGPPSITFVDCWPPPWAKFSSSHSLPHARHPSAVLSPAMQEYNANIDTPEGQVEFHRFLVNVGTGAHGVRV